MIYWVLLLLVGAVQCHAQYSCSCGDLRLTNMRSSENEGNVEFCWNGEWLAVRYSTSSSSSIVPSLICQQLGYSAKDYQTSASTVFGYNIKSVNFDCNQESCCDGEETTLRTCDHVIFNPHRSRYQRLRIHCVEHSNNTIPDIVSVTNVEAAAVSLKWRLVERDELGNFMVECSSINHVAYLLVNNQTFIAQLNGLLPHTDYNCCVSALYDGYKTRSCTSISTDITASSGSASARNADTIGGVLGFIIIILLLLLILAIVALVYPCLIRPRIQNHRTLSRLSNYLDRKVYNDFYRISTTASAKSSSEEERQRSTITSTGVSTIISAGRRTTAVNKCAESVPTQHSDATQAYEPLNYYSPVQTLATSTVTSCTTDVPRIYEPAAYALPSTCMGQSSDTADHVYAVLEEPIN